MVAYVSLKFVSAAIQLSPSSLKPNAQWMEWLRAPAAYSRGQIRCFQPSLEPGNLSGSMFLAEDKYSPGKEERQKREMQRLFLGLIAALTNGYSLIKKIYN